MGFIKDLLLHTHKKKVYSHSEGNAKCLNLSEGEIVFIKRIFCIEKRF